MPPKVKKEKKLTERPQDGSKRLTLTEKLLIKAEKGTRGSVRVAKEFGCSNRTVQKIWANEKLAQFDSKVAKIKEIMSGKLYLTANSAVNQANKMLPQASAAQAAVIMAIMIEKARLIDDKSTQNVSHNVYLDLINSVPVDEKFDE